MDTSVSDTRHGVGGIMYVRRCRESSSSSRENGNYRNKSSVERDTLPKPLSGDPNTGK